MRKFLKIFTTLAILLLTALFLQARYIDWNPQLYGVFDAVNEVTAGYVNRYGFYVIIGRSFFIHWWYILLPLTLLYILSIIRNKVRKSRNRTSPLYDDEDDFHDDLFMEDEDLLPGVFMEAPYEGDTWTLAVGKIAGKKTKKTGPVSDRNAGEDAFDPEIFLSLTRALSFSLDVEIAYHNGHDEFSERRITPYRMYRSKGIYYLQAYCHIRDEDRTFRVDRIEGIIIGEPAL